MCRAIALATNLTYSAPGFGIAFADAGGVRAAAALVAASPRQVQAAPQARAVALLAALARLPALAAALADAAADAPELSTLVRDALAAAAADAYTPSAAADTAAEDTTSGKAPPSPGRPCSVTGPTPIHLYSCLMHQGNRSHAGAAFLSKL